MYYDSSNTWVVDGSFRSREGRIEYELRQCVEITQLRITGKWMCILRVLLYFTTVVEILGGHDCLV